MGTILYPDGQSKEVHPANGTDYQLAELQAIVGGHIEVVHLRDGKRIMIVNEEGKLEGLPYNEQATKLAELPTVEERLAAFASYREQGVDLILGSDPMEEDYISGIVLVCFDDEVR